MQFYHLHRTQVDAFYASLQALLENVLFQTAYWS